MSLRLALHEQFMQIYLRLEETIIKKNMYEIIITIMWLKDSNEISMEVHVVSTDLLVTMTSIFKWMKIMSVKCTFSQVNSQ